MASSTPWRPNQNKEYENYLQLNLVWLFSYKDAGTEFLYEHDKSLCPEKKQGTIFLDLLEIICKSCG